MELLETKNNISVFLDYDHDCENPRDGEHFTRIRYGANPHCRVAKCDVVGPKEHIEDVKNCELFYWLDAYCCGPAIIFIEKDTYEAEYGGHATPTEVLTAVWDEYAAWARGECFGYIVKGRGDNVLDSCWGFIGREHAEEAARDSLAYWADSTPAETGIPGTKFEVKVTI